jgi:hypothetical protein
LHAPFVAHEALQIGDLPQQIGFFVFGLRRFGFLGSDSCPRFLARCGSVLQRPIERSPRLGELLLQKAALVFEAFRLPAQGLNLGEPRQFWQLRLCDRVRQRIAKSA